MLFNSFSFLLAYLPVTAFVYFLLARRSDYLAAAWLAGASIFFYGYWDHRYVPLLLASIVFNYWAALQMREAQGRRRKRWLVLAISVDLLLLGYYKYADFFLSSIRDMAGLPPIGLDIILPIGISFFTFTQIAFLVDTYQGKVNESRFVHYVLFVTYFPHLIAGPVLHHKEMMPQFADRRNYVLSTENLAIGATIFFIGLAKKVLIADNLAPYAGSLFEQPSAPSLLVAWGGVLAYTFQLYFDFSGYSDMAVGLSRIFGVKLPINFFSPYKATNISEFWRRWHMTLSRFLRDYLYIPLGGNRKGPTRRYVNLIVTMLLGGLWHGAGWNFVIWGGLHGLYLVIQHAWSAAAERLRLSLASGWNIVFTAITFVAVCYAWVFFRAANLSTAWEIVQGMTGFHGVGIPEAVGIRLGGFKPMLEQAGVTFFLGGGSRFLETWAWVAVAAGIVFFLPNTYEITRRFDPALDVPDQAGQGNTGPARIFVWTPSRRWATALGILALASVLSLNRPSEFLYFQF